MLSRSSNQFSRLLKLISSSRIIPHPAKAHFGGEDACFISKNNLAIGVADGVGGWADQPGADAKKYARDMMKFCDQSSDLESPLEMIKKAYSKLDLTIPGSTTVCVGKLNDRMLTICNIGDSGLFVYRDNKTIFQTQPTQFGFNFPFQLGFRAITKPEQGTIDKVPLRVGDILIAATDGVWDNIYDDKIEKIIEESTKNGSKSQIVKLIANTIAETANKNGQDTTFFSPFCYEAFQITGRKMLGGKLDDVTVVSSIVVPDDYKE